MSHVSAGALTVMLLLAGGTTAGETTRTVLLADDDDAFRETMCIWLGEEWEVQTAENGAEALAALDASVDVLVLDRRMPGLTGPEVVDRLAKTSFDGAVVVLSAFEPDAHLDERRVTTYLTKPVTREQFLAHLEACIE